MSYKNVCVNSDNAPTFRINIRRIFTRILFGDLTLGTNMEIGIYNYALKDASRRHVVKKWDNEHFVVIYLDRVHTLFCNLKSADKQILVQLKDVLLTSPSTVSCMTHQEMNMDRWQALIDAKRMKDNSALEPTMEALTDLFTCSKCRQNKCSYYQLQTRSADEPMTTFVTCCNCGNRWRFS